MSLSCNLIMFVGKTTRLGQHASSYRWCTKRIWWCSGNIFI